MKKIIAWCLLISMMMFLPVTNGETATPEKVYRTLYSGEVSTLNYLTAGRTGDQTVGANVIDTLVEYDAAGQVIPGLAESWETSEDELTWTFHLRKGQMWLDHTGEEKAEVTAQDFVDGLRYVLTASNESGVAYAVSTAHIQHADAYYNGEVTDFSQVGIKALDPNADVQYDDEYFELMHSTSDKLSLRDAMNLQRNRLEGTDFKPQDQMELDGKGIPDRTKVDSVYKYPISNPNVMEAHIFQLKENLPASTGGGILWLAMGSPRNAPYLPYYGNISNTSQPYQEMSTAYNENSWYWTVSRINDLVAKYPELFEDGSIRSEIERLETQWMEEQPALDKEQISLSEQPEEASLKATKTSLERDELVFKRLKEIQKKAEDKVVKEYGTKALEEIEESEDSNLEETIYLEEFDYDIAIAGAIFVITVIGVAIYLVKRKKDKGVDGHE